MSKTKTICFVLIIAAASLIVSPDSGAQELSLKECQRIQEKIDYYDELRRRGGTAQEMEYWRKEREKYSDNFRDAHCRKYGSKIQ